MSAPVASRTLVIVTGASSGIGLGAAEAAAADPATYVATVSRREGPGSAHLAADLADPGSWPVVAAWIDDLVSRQPWERVTFIHSAATLTPIGFAGAVDAAEYQANVLLNSASPQVLGDGFLRSVQRAGVPSVLVQISSGAGKNPYPGWSSYCAAKAAVDLWVRTVGLEAGHHVVGGAVAPARVLSLSPGVVATPMQAEIRESEVDAFPNVDRFRSMHDEGQLADPATVGAKVWRISQDPDWISGAVADLSDFA